MEGFAERVAALSPEQRALLERRLKRAGLDPARLDAGEGAIPRRARRDEYPLSFAQRRLWFVDQFLPGTALYNMPAALRVSGAIDAADIARSLEAVVARHETLRTTFAVVAGEPVQVIAPRLPVPVPVVDLQDLPATEREAEARRLARAEAERGFDLARGPLLRATLLRLAPDDHVLLLTMHHIVSDGWSMRLLVEEAAARAAGVPAPLPPLAIQYADYAAWQRDRLSGEALDGLLAYWRTRLAGSVALDLPGDRPRPSLPSHRAGTLRFQWPAELGVAIAALAGAAGATPFMVLLAAFQAVLHAHAGQDDIVVGCPIAGRNQRGTERLIGCFVNILMMRTDCSGDPTFRELLGRVREVALGAYAHQDLPVEMLLDEIQPRRDGGGPLPALARVGFGYDLAPDTALAAPGLKLAPLEIDRGTAPLDLFLAVWDRGGRLGGLIDYSAELFDASTVAGILARLEALLQRAIADPDLALSALVPEAVPARRQLQARSGVGSARAEAAPEDLTDLTRGQLLVWAGQALAPELPVYSLAMIYHLSGEIEPEPFVRAFEVLVRRTDTLAMVIEATDGVPRQRAVELAAPTMECVDLWEDPDPPEALRRWAAARARRPLDPAVRLFDAALVKLSARCWAWYLSLHHLASDGWSFSVMFTRQRELYEHALAGRLDASVTFPTYADFASHERRYRQSPRWAADEAYWRDKLDRHAEPLRFYGREDGRRGTEVIRLSQDLGAERTRRLEAAVDRPEFAERTRNLARFHLLLAVFAAFVHRTSGHGCPMIGVALLNRPSRAFKDTVGFFAQAAPLALHVAPEDRLSAVVQRVKRELAETLRHQRYAVRNTDRRAYDVEFDLATSIEDRDFAGAATRVERLHTGHGTAALYLVVDSPQVTRANYVLHFDLNADVFDAAAQDRIAGDFLRVLDAFLDDPGQRVGAVELLAPAERDRVLVEWNRTRVAWPDERPLLALIAARAVASPDAVAVVGGTATLTYGELWRRAGALSTAFARLGLAREERVGVYLERSPAVLVAMLAIWRAGGAYLPLDPADPPERLAAMLDGAGARAVVTDGALRSRLPAAPPIVCVDPSGALAPAPAATGDAGPTLDGPVSGEALAYVLYTSGSTGAPKGAMVEHRGMLNHLHAKVRDLGLTADDALAQTAPLGFDISVWQFLAPLLAGGRVWIADEATARDPVLLLDEAERAGVTVLEVVPSLLRGMVDALPPAAAGAAPGRLRWLIATGEALPPDLCRRWLAARPATPLVNAYGPTECSDDVTHHVIDRAPAADEPRIPVGRPLPNTQLYVLDAGLRPVPPGVAGEICVGGAGVGRGYVGRPDLTAERFVPDPFGDAPGRRLYRTGDLGRHRPDGAVEYLGRADQQVKLFGVRIELGEIEARLAEHPALREGAVQMAGDRLVAFVVPREAAPAPAELAAFLRRHLPDSMIPAAFVFLAALPLTANGKLDRRALVPPGRARDERAPLVAPRDAIEADLARMWEELLDVRPVSVTDSFFDLGGHSLLAVRLILRIRERFGHILPLSSLVQGATVEHLARVVRLRDGATPASPLVRLQPAGDRPPLVCVHPIGGSVLGYFELARHLGADQPVWGLQAPGLDAEREPLPRLEDVAAEYVAALRAARPAGPYRFAGHSLGGLVAFEMARQLDAQGHRVEVLALLDVQAPGASEPIGDKALQELLARLARQMGATPGPIDLSTAEVAALPHDEAVEHMLDRLVAARALPVEVGRSEARRHLSVLLGHARAAVAYAPGRYPGQALLLTAAEGGAGGSVETWRGLIAGGVEAHVVPGDHESMLREPHVRALAARLRARL